MNPLFQIGIGSHRGMKDSLDGHNCIFAGHRGFLEGHRPSQMIENFRYRSFQISMLIINGNKLSKMKLGSHIWTQAYPSYIQSSLKNIDTPRQTLIIPDHDRVWPNGERSSGCLYVFLDGHRIEAFQKMQVNICLPRWILVTLGGHRASQIEIWISRMDSHSIWK